LRKKIAKNVAQPYVAKFKTKHIFYGEIIAQNWAELFEFHNIANIQKHLNWRKFSQFGHPALCESA
jgi:hypothetical protein